MKVSDITAKEPESNVIEIKPDCRYLVLIKSPLTEANNTPEAVEAETEIALEICKMIGVGRSLVFFVDAPSSVRVLEFERRVGLPITFDANDINSVTKPLPPYYPLQAEASHEPYQSPAEHCEPPIPSDAPSPDSPLPD